MLKYLAMLSGTQVVRHVGMEVKARIASDCVSIVCFGHSPPLPTTFALSEYGWLWERGLLDTDFFLQPAGEIGGGMWLEEVEERGEDGKAQEEVGV